ncbi:MAG: transporter substrate-binding domain-containing protein [Clostridia bacterium]|nr:transporter substrate-binding domain-containing protein [Clostridia bacterium]
MKKILSLMLVLIMCAALFCGCGSEAEKKTIKSLEDLDGCKVAVQIATTSDDIITELIEGGKTITANRYEKVTQCFDDLSLGRVDAVLVDSVVAAYYMGADADKFEISWESTEGEPMGICLNKNSTELAEVIEAAIDTLYYDGTISTLAKKHFGNDFTAGLRTVTEKPVIDTAKIKTMTNGVLTIGAEVGYPPMEYLADDGVTYIGFDIDIANAIGELLGLEVKFINTAWDGIFAALEKGEFDCIISSVSITEERQEKYILTEPYVSNRQQIVVAK